MHIPEEQKIANGELAEKTPIVESPAVRFGRAIREAREHAGYTIERVALSSRISLGLLKSLEEFRADRLPGRAFVRGFVRNLCKLYQIDSTEMLLLAEEAMGKDASDAKPQPLKKEDPKWDLSQEHKPWRSRKIRRAGALFIARHFQLVPLLSFVVILGVFGAGFFYMIKLLTGIPDGMSSAKSVGQAITSELNEVTRKAQGIRFKSDLAPGVASTLSLPRVVEPQAASVVFFAGGAAPQHLEIKANEAARLEIQKDGDALVGLQLEPKNHLVMFSDHAEIFMRNPKSVQLSLDGRNIDPVVRSGQTMRITFKKFPQIKQKKSKI